MSVVFVLALVSLIFAEVQLMIFAGGAMCIYLRLAAGFEDGNDVAVIGELVFAFVMGLHALLPTLKGTLRKEVCCANHQH